jgi:acetyltransferase-like isoleucine patch superfamily enzyme
LITNIQFIPDLLRNTRAFTEGFFDLVREPILQGCGIQAGASPESRFAHGLKPGFSVEIFRELAGWDASDVETSWLRHYFALPTSACDYLLAHLPADTLILSFEMPPWLSDLLDRQQTPYLDIRVSPLRFGRDLYIALRTNQESLHQRLQAYVVSAEELRLEAAALAASVRMHQQRLEESGRYPLDLDNTLVYIGQAPYDASLLSDKHSTALRCTDFADQLRELAQGRRLLHKAHPFAADFAKEEQRALAGITGQTVGTCYQNAYQLLSCDHDVVLVGISSGMLQEASWFGKEAHTLFQPVVPVPLADTAPSSADFQQVHFEEWLSPGFWHAVLTPEKPAPHLLKLPTVHHHHARQSLDQWWDYAKVMTWEKSLPIESFERSGGILLRQRIEALEQGRTHHGLSLACPPGNDVMKPDTCTIHGSIQITGTGNVVRCAEDVIMEGAIVIHGNNNLVDLGKGCHVNAKLAIFGDCNTISIGERVVFGTDGNTLVDIAGFTKITGQITANGAHNVIYLDSGSTFGKVDFRCFEGKRILIGKECMFSYGIEARTADGHPILNNTPQLRLNPAKDIRIGDHVWVGRGATLLKGTSIADHSIVGANAVTSSRFEEQHVIITGIPAKIQKRGVSWLRDSDAASIHAPLPQTVSAYSVEQAPTDTLRLLYIPWIESHTDALVNLLRRTGEVEFIPLPLLEMLPGKSRAHRHEIMHIAHNQPAFFKQCLLACLAKLTTPVHGLLLTLDWCDGIRQAATILREMGIPTMLVPHESVFAQEAFYYRDPRTGIDKPMADHLFVWGQLQAEVFKKRGFPADKITVTGSPKLDAIRHYQSPLSREQHYQRYGLQEDKPVLLFVTQALDGQFDTPTALSRQSVAIQDCLAFCHAHDWNMVVRMPPARGFEILDLALYGELLKASCAVTDGVHGSHYVATPEDAMFHANVVVSINSTMLLEASLMDRPAISLGYVPSNQLWHKQAGLPLANHRDELIKYLQHAKEVGGSLLTKEGCAWVQSAYSAGDFDGKAATRILQAIKAKWPTAVTPDIVLGT